MVVRLKATVALLKPGPSLDDVGRGAWRNVQPDKYVARLRKGWK